jgi:hypothetical protein
MREHKGRKLSQPGLQTTDYSLLDLYTGKLLRRRVTGLGWFTGWFTGQWSRDQYAESCVSNRFQRGSLLKEARKGASDVWVLRFYEYKEGKRKYRRQIIGTVTELPLKRDAEKAAAPFRENINSVASVPQTVSELIVIMKRMSSRGRLLPARRIIVSLSTNTSSRAGGMIDCLPFVPLRSKSG